MKKIFKFLFGWIGKLFASAGSFAEKVLPIVIGVTNTLKYKVDSPVADILVAITPTGIDDAVLAKIRAVLPKVVEKTALAQKWLAMSKDMTTNELLQAILGELKNSSNDEWQKFWAEFSGMFLYYMADGKLTVGEAIALAQWYYNEKPEKI